MPLVVSDLIMQVILFYVFTFVSQSLMMLFQQIVKQLVKWEKDLFSYEESWFLSVV